MAATFPIVRKSRLGYNIADVDEFLLNARRAYDAALEETGDIAGITRDSRWIRQTTFPLVKGGYSPEHVDAALERLEEAFAARERERMIRAHGEDYWYESTRAKAREILSRLERTDGERFRRTGRLAQGYSVPDVDEFARSVVRYFRAGAPVGIEDIRGVVFRAQRGGYDESQVDAVLDAVVEVMLAVR